MNEVYCFSKRVEAFDCDLNLNMKVSAMLRIMQETSEAQCILFGMGMEGLFANGKVFLLVRHDIEVRKSPRFLQEVVCKTWSRGANGVQFFRDFEILDKEGNILVCANSYWVLVDVATHRILRPNAIQLTIPTIDRVVKENRPKVKVQAGEFCFSHVVRYSDLDVNSHLTNSRYADLIQDAINHFGTVKTFDINFSLEAKAGEQIDIFLTKKQNQFEVVGQHQNGSVCFDATVTI